jgi:hypothetical protein
MTGESTERTVSHDHYNDCYRDQPSASDAAACCVVGISPDGFRFTVREICCMTEHEGQNGFRTGRSAIGLASLSFLFN